MKKSRGNIFAAYIFAAMIGGIVLLNCQSSVQQDNSLATTQEEESQEAAKTEKSKEITPSPLSDALFSAEIAEIKGETIRFKGKRPCIIDFYADWCVPCRIMSPIFHALANQYKDQIDFYKVNTDYEPQLAHKLSIELLPTLIIFDKDGKVMRLEGYQEKATLVQCLDAVLP